MDLLNKHIVVTGTASGLGAAIAQACLTEGAVVTGIDLDRGNLERQHVADVGDETQMADLFKAIGRVDALVNSAGIARRDTVEDTAMNDFDEVMRVNLRGVFLASKYALPWLRKHGGSILHLSSVVGLTGIRNRSAYSASKGALIALTRNMALDYADEGVRVNCLCPGFVKTALLKSLLQDKERTAKLTALHPLGRLGEASDVANAALFLLSDKAKWITGQAIAVDGGLSVGHAMDI